MYKTNANVHSKSFTLSFKQFLDFWQRPCYYCGIKIDTIGLDRVNNKFGYTIKNVVSCCKIHNFMKGKLDQDSFIKACISVAKHHKET